MKAMVTQVEPVGMGDRVCVDLCNLLNPGEGLLVHLNSFFSNPLHIKNMKHPFICLNFLNRSIVYNCIVVLFVRRYEGLSSEVWFAQVGSFERALFLVHSEYLENDDAASRPFRVNAVSVLIVIYFMVLDVPLA